MEYPKEQVDALKPYCKSLKLVTEGGVQFFLLEEIRLPLGCEPTVCDALLCPVEREGYPSRLYFSVEVKSPYTRGWKVSEARIAERNWYVFSWKLTLSEGAPLVQILIGHLNGFAKEK